MDYPHKGLYKYARKWWLIILPVLSKISTMGEWELVFGGINLLYIWSSELISVYKEVIRQLVTLMH